MKRLLAALLILTTSAFATDGPLQIGYGAMAKGIGGAGIAFPQDAFAIGNNPAGLMLLCPRSDGAVVGLDAKTDAIFRINNLGVQSKSTLHSNQTSVWPELAAFGKPCHNVAVGYAIFLAGGYSTDYGAPISTPLLDGTRNLSADYNVGYISPAVAWQINPCHTLGLAFNVAFGIFKTSGLEELQADSVASRYTTNRGYDTQEGISIRIGWIGELLCDLTFGVTYQTKTWMSHLDHYRGLLPDAGNLDLPAQLGFGFAYHPNRCLDFALDFVRICWSDTKWYRHDEDNGERYGDRDGPGLGWTDQWAIKFGAAFKPWQCLTLRAGYHYGDPTFTLSRGLLNLLSPTLVRHHATVGATFGFRCYEISVAYIYGFRQSTSTRIEQNGPIIQRSTVKTCQQAFSVQFSQRF